MADFDQEFQLLKYRSYEHHCHKNRKTVFKNQQLTKRNKKISLKIDQSQAKTSLPTFSGGRAIAARQEEVISGLWIPTHHTCLWKRIKWDNTPAYMQSICDTISEADIKLIRDTPQREPLTGRELFRQEVSQRRGIRISNKGPGQPRKANKQFCLPFRT